MERMEKIEPTRESKKAVYAPIDQRNKKHSYKSKYS